MDRRAGAAGRAARAEQQVRRRYAFIALPAGSTLDLNYIHNQALKGNLGNNIVNPPSAGDTFFRNQGVGSWEINLAAFLADLNYNEWGQTIGNSLNGNATYYYYQYNPNNAGYSFDDARALLTYRYNNDFGSLPYLPTVLPNYPLFPINGGPVDIFPFGNPIGTPMNGTGVPYYNYSFVNKPWPGANSTNHFFALPSDLFDPTKTEMGVTPAQIAINNDFIWRLSSAGTSNSTYDRYTFYRLLSQLGTDSLPESGKMNLNYDNLSIHEPFIWDIRHFPPR